MRYKLKMNLLALRNAAVMRIKGKSDTKLCLVVPIEENHLYVGEKGVYLDLSAFELRETGRHGESHLLKRSLPKNAYNTMSEEERRALPLLGSMAPVENQAKAVAAADAPVGYAEDADELPF